MPGSATFDVASVGNLEVGGRLRLTNYIDDSATTGNRTVNRNRGKNAFAIGASSVTITNNLVTADSHIVCTLEFVDATLTQILTCIPGSGSFVATANANATAATKFSWTVIN